MPLTINGRTPEAYIEPTLLQRWSPRAFRAHAIPANVLRGLFEAARWAPSAYNEQPWMFTYATQMPERDKFLSLLVPQNQVWARHAPVIGFVACRHRFSANGTPNRTAAFDAGQACMALQLQAIRYGLHVHFMSGFDTERAQKHFRQDPQTVEILAAFALGLQGDPETLPEALQAIEEPSQRRPQKLFVGENLFPPMPESGK